MAKLQFLFNRFSTLWYDPTGNQTRPTNIGGLIKKHFLIQNYF